MNQERLIQIIRAPIVSEKSTMLANKYQQSAFRVASDATKIEIKAAVEMLFDVKVQSVNIINVKGKKKRFGRIFGCRKNWKKAYVSLMPGQSIDPGATVKTG